MRDLGLVARDDPIRIANPIYREVIPRDLTWTTQAGLTHDPAWYVDAAGNLLLADLWERKLFRHPPTGAGPPITVWGM